MVLRVIILLLLSLSGKGQTVYKTPSGKKYHLESCRMVNNVSSEITLAEASALGLEPCRICRPKPLLIQGSNHKAKGVNRTVQCSGITKKGTRCRRMTSIANGYCFQHNPDKD